MLMKYKSIQNIAVKWKVVLGDDDGVGVGGLKKSRNHVERYTR